MRYAWRSNLLRMRTIPLLMYATNYRSQEGYVSKEIDLEQYQHTMSDVTRAFQALSSEVITTVKEFRESRLTEAAGILEQLQQAEKEKLELTVQWQVLSQHERGGGDSEEMEDFGAAEHKKSDLRKRYN